MFENEKKHRGGRPCKLTPQLQAKLVELIRAGSYIGPAVAACGISDQTFKNWMERGETATSGKFFGFFGAVTSAEAELEVELVREWRAAARDDWRANAEFLARRWRSRWGRTSSVEMSGPCGAPIETHITNEQIHQAIENEIALGVAAALERGESDADDDIQREIAEFERLCKGNSP